jgi:CRISPR-associated protein Cas2
MRTSYLICYDICDDKRQPKVFQTMRNYGDHLQYSVFECQLTSTDLARCRSDLATIIHHNEDQVLFAEEDDAAAVEQFRTWAFTISRASGGRR